MRKQWRRHRRYAKLAIQQAQHPVKGRLYRASAVVGRPPPLGRVGRPAYQGKPPGAYKQDIAGTGRGLPAYTYLIAKTAEAQWDWWRN